MRKFWTLLSLLFCMPYAAAQVLQFADLNTREIDKLDRSKTVIIVPGAILEEHGPYLPSGSDGIFNSHLAADLARVIAARPGWKAVIIPSIPLGAGAANEMGHKYSFPGSCSVLPSTLRTILMDIGDQLGAEHFRWVIVIHGHGDPAHNRMIDQAGDYFHETYGGEMVNLFGYLWAMKLADFRTPEQQRADGLPEHATMTETSVILSLQPQLVAADYKTAPPHPGQSIKELEDIASKEDWPGYFGAPALASASLGRAMYNQWLERSTELIDQVLSGRDYRRLPRYGDLYADDSADAAATSVNQRLESQHEAWINKRAHKPSPARSTDNLEIPAGLLGVWKLQSIEDQRSDGKPGYDVDLGPNVNGYLTIDKNGIACIQGMKVDRAKWIETADKTGPSDAEFLAHARGFFGYCVDHIRQRGSSLVGHIATSNDPNEVGAEWERPFSLTEGRLLLQPVFVQAGVRIQRTATFDRVK